MELNAPPVRSLTPPPEASKPHLVAIAPSEEAAAFAAFIGATT